MRTTLDLLDDRSPSSELISDMVYVALAYACLDFDARIHVQDYEDSGDLLELADTLNMLGRKLADTTVAAEVAERANEELRHKNAELDEFAYIASHDLQEPLRKIITFSDMLKLDLGDRLDPDSAENLAFLVDAARRMQQLIGDLLALSRSGRVTLARRSVPLDDCVDRALANLDHRIRETRANIERDPLPEVQGDPTLLAQVYQNLLANALKFAGDAPPNLRITCEQGPDGWIFGVADQGIGLRPEYADQIFRPFKRLHGRTEYPGTGIGLSIVRKVVVRHGGKVWVESEPGRGAHFRFTLGSEEEVRDAA